jgi:ketosteroid isomerase-like protein
MRSVAILAAAVLAAASAARAEDAAVVAHGDAKAAAEIARAEQAFAARSREAGAATAFAEYCDPTDSRALMGGEPTRGAAAIAKAHAGEGKLDWTPREVFAAKAGDMGVAWGEFRYTPPKGPAFGGRYVTVWRKDAKGQWKVIMDAGSPDQPGG